MGDLAGSEIHIVYSARDLGRQLPAAWQESIKQGRRWSFRRFLRRGRERRAVVLPRLRPPGRPGDVGRRPAPRAHPRGDRAAARSRRQHGDLLWRRFCEALRHRARLGAGRQRPERTVRSGMAETQLVRELNRPARPRATRREPEYDNLIREMLAQQQLVEAGVARRCACPPRRLAVGAGADGALGQVARAAAACTSSATSTTCGRCRWPRASGPPPRPGPARRSWTPPWTRSTR